MNSDSTESAIAMPEIANQILRRPTMSTRCQAGICSLDAPMNAGLSNQRKRASMPRIARVANTAVTSESPVPIKSMSAKPRTPDVATRKMITAEMTVTMFASTIVANPF
jgi:hypothetical protein